MGAGRVRLTVAYDGRGFHGFAVQPGDVATVGGALTDALARVVGAPVRLTAAGRTDTGVHAWGQVVSFDAPDENLDLARIQRSVNTQLGPRIVVREAALAAPDFDARRSARSRIYRYTVLNRVAPDPFRAATSWHVDEPLDLGILRLACDPLIGEHDFSAFCRVPRGSDDIKAYSLVRRVIDARWDAIADETGDGILRFQIEASSFCQQMVRALVGTMVPMAAGRRKAGELSSILRSRSRQVAGRVAPPQGLCLWAVRYGV